MPSRNTIVFGAVALVFLALLGSGAVREVIELILKAQGKWDEILRHYEVVT